MIGTMSFTNRTGVAPERVGVVRPKSRVGESEKVSEGDRVVRCRARQPFEQVLHNRYSPRPSRVFQGLQNLLVLHVACSRSHNATPPLFV